MNIDRWNAGKSPIDAHDLLAQPHRLDQQPGELSAQTALTYSSADRRNFEQQLSDMHSGQQTSCSAPAKPDSGAGTSSSAPNETTSKNERYPAASFARARAQLAATLTGATLEALKNEIGLAEQQSGRWSCATGSPDDGFDRDRIFNEVVASSYVKLRRFQDQDGDCKPRTEENTSAISHVRNTAREHSSVGDHLERYPLDRARQAGWHMRGKITAAAFVSLVEDPSKLVASRDHWARAIANNASMLHTYTVPTFAVWTPDHILSTIGLGMNAEDQDNIDADVDLMCSLGRTPTQETERLFLGGNLNHYRTASEANPYKREGGK